MGSDQLIAGRWREGSGSDRIVGTEPATAPFGGAAGTRTGWGRIGGKFTMLDMTDLRTAVIDLGNTREGQGGTE